MESDLYLTQLNKNTNRQPAVPANGSGRYTIKGRLPPKPYTIREYIDQLDLVPLRSLPPEIRRQKIGFMLIKYFSRMLLVLTALVFFYAAVMLLAILHPPTCRMSCNYSKVCICTNQICNGVPDCPYGDDEQNCGCGVSYNSVANYKVGGANAAYGNWPWQVGLRYKTGLLCGGSIISPKWIVTAAHCVYGSRSNASGWKVFAGALTLPSYSDANGYSVERIIVFPGYNSSDNDNDIALMKLTDKITFNYNTQPVCLPNAGMFWEAGTQCWISGWGTTAQGDNIARTLQYAEVQLVPSHVCNQSHVYNGSITPSMLCADGLYGWIGSCQGDAGGPLVTKTNGTWWLVGDTSWGVGCAQPNTPGVYGNMAMFVEWIYLQMKT
ncbi:transmembrane protease serine 2-like [Xenopus tropicalis]|uniref:Transmembrane protease serine 2-like n=1 Tax=Xenopus tropicalis TaxID=8364 RepID=A0A8J1J3G7_XENTR|nr:transmembrane protease serine 2-like [Xenopus tropicalis]